MQHRFKGILALGLLFSLLLVGCGGGASDYEGAAEVEEVKSAAPETLEVTPELAAILAGADGADGESDHVVSQCTNCALGMEGVAEHAVTVGEYELYFCSEGCLNDFSGNAEMRLMALNTLGAEAAADQVEAP